MAAALTRGQGMWWFDMTVGWYDDPAIGSGLRPLIEIARRLAAGPRQDVTEVALVVDEASLTAACGPQDRWRALLPRQCQELASLGAPFDVVLLRDLERANPYRLLLFPVLFEAGEEVRGDLHRILARNRATAVWIGDPAGATALLDPLAPARLVGMSLSTAPEPHAAVIEVEDGGRRLSYGAWQWWASGNVVTDSAPRVLGNYAGTSLPGLAILDMGAWTSVFSGAPAVPARLLRGLARDAGVQIYADGGDGIAASGSLLGLTARRAGAKLLHVPGTDVLYDPVHDVELVGEAGRFRTWVAAGDTLLCYRGSRTAWFGAVRQVSP
jgi:hypothetical protein